MFRTLVKPVERNSFIIYVPNRTAKSQLPIVWERPPKTPVWRADKAGDLKQVDPVDLKRLPTLYEKSTELQTANDLVRRLFTLEFLPKPEMVKVLQNDYRVRVNRHTYDTESCEAHIAGMTGSIRDLQARMEKFTTSKPPRIMRVHCKELIEGRFKWLERLRMSDYKKYEWILEKLDIVHKPTPTPNPEKVERKKSMRRLTDIYCQNLRQSRLDQYREYLESQQEEFLKKKLETLKWIQDKEKELNEEATVSDVEIENVRKRLEEVISRKKETIVD